MMDFVALASVVSSGVVAVGGLLVTYRGGREQRAHEAGLSYEARIWEHKSAALVDAIGAARVLVDALREDSEYLGYQVPDAIDRLRNLVPAIEAYASTDCRVAFESLRETLGTANVDILASSSVALQRQRKEDAIDAGDVEAALAARDRERKILRTSKAGLNLDVKEAEGRARRLIEAARESLRSNAV